MNQKYLQTIYDSEEDRQLARILPTLVWTMWGMYLVIILISIFYDQDWNLIAVTLVGSVLLIEAMLLLRRGRLRASSLLVVLSTLGTVTFIAIVGQGIRDLALVAFPIIFIFAGLTLNRVLFRVCVGLALAAVCWLVLGEIFGWFVPVPFVGEMANWIYLVVTNLILLVAALAVDFLAVNMRKNLELARQKIDERKRAEEKIINSEKRFHALIEHGRDNISLLAADGSLLWESPTVNSILGYSPNQFVGHNIFELMHPADQAWTGALYERVVQSPGSIQEGEFRLLHADGTWRWIECSASNLLDVPGVQAIVLNYRDITARKRAEEALEKSESKYRRMVETANEGVIVLDRDTQITLVNQQVADMLGYTIEELLGQKLESLFFEEDLGDHQAQMTLRAQGQNAVYERCFRRKDGGRLWTIISATAITDTEGRFDGAFGMLTDITERKKAEEALRESEERYRTLFQQASDGIFYLSTDGKVVTVNESFARMHGYSVEEMQGMSLQDLDTPENVYQISERMRRVLAGEVIEFESEHYHKDGHSFPLAVSTGLITAGGDQLIQAFHRDITERRRAEEALRESEQKHRRLFESMSQGVIYYSASGKIISANPAAERILGITFDQLQGKTFVNTAWKLIREDGSELPDEEHPVAMALRTGKPVERDIIGISSPNMNATFWLSITAIPLFNPDGKTLSQVYSTFEDITERKRAESALKLSEEKFVKAFQMNPSVIVLARTRDARVVEINDTFTKVIGYARDEIIGSTTLEKGLWVDPHDRERLLTQLSTGVVLKNVEVFFRTKDQRVIRCSSSFEMLEIEGELHILAVMEDITERKRAEDALRESEAKFRAVVENSNDGILFGDANATIHYRSPSYNRINGYTDEERVGHSGFETAHPDDLEDLRCYWAKLIEHPETSHRTEYRIRHKDGTWRWIETTGQNLLGNTDVHSVIVTSRDITERKRAEDALRENAIRYRTLLDNLPQLVWQRDLDSVFVDGNIACARTLGTTVEELAGKTDYDFYPVELAEKYRADDRRVIANGASETFEERFLTDGSERFARTTKVPLRDDLGRLYGTLGISEDITESRLSEMALRESEQRFREVLENSLDASYKRNLKTNAYEYLSPVFEKIFSYTPDDFVHLPLETVLELIHPDDRAMGDRVIAEALSGAHSSIYQWDYRFRHKDGQYRWLHDQFIMMRDAQGQPAAWIGSVSDITELKRAEEDRIAREIAEQANRAKSEFISRMSHELRTPLNAILGFSQLLKMDELKPNQTRGLEQIYKSGRHLLNLVNEVLDIARIESGKLHISPEPVCMADTLQEALELIRALAEARGISIHLETPASSDVFVQADPQSLRQVLLNLLSNAVKYNREGGEIIITVSLTIDGHLRLQVRDTGEGIPPEKMERLFVPFDRLDRDSIEQEGTGLGLALSKGLVEAMGGRIGAQSKPGEGSIFWLELKLVTERLTDAILAEVNEHISEQMRSKRGLVLYVEDNLDNLKLVEAIMERLPWVKLITAMQGRLALELAQEYHPDLILLDLHLPDMHGSEVLRRLKAGLATQKTPVVILSADAMPEHIADLLAGGARAYLTKPIDIQEFLKVVEESLVEPNQARKAGQQRSR